MQKIKNILPKGHEKSWKAMLLDWSIYIVLLILVFLLNRLAGIFARALRKKQG